MRILFCLLVLLAGCAPTLVRPPVKPPVPQPVLQVQPVAPEKPPEAEVQPPVRWDLMASPQWVPAGERLVPALAGNMVKVIPWVDENGKRCWVPLYLTPTQQRSSRLTARRSMFLRSR